MKQNNLQTYAKLFLFICNLAIAFVIVRFPFVRHLIVFGGKIDYVGAFLAGILYVYTFSVAIGIVLILLLGHTFSPWVVTFIAATGATVGDYLLLHAANHISSKISKPLPHWMRKWLHTSHFKWIIVSIGIITLVTPLPDEFGISILSASNLSTAQLVILFYIFQVLSIMLLLQVVKI